MSFKKYQEYYVKKMFMKNEIKNYNGIYTKFKNQFKIEFILTQKEITDIKYMSLSKTNNLDFYELCKSIRLEKEQSLEINC